MQQLPVNQHTLSGCGSGTNQRMHERQAAEHCFSSAASPRPMFCWGACHVSQCTQHVSLGESQSYHVHSMFLSASFSPTMHLLVGEVMALTGVHVGACRAG